MSEGEDELALHLKIYGIEAQREFRFDPTRRWRLDFVVLSAKLGIEVEGITPSGGRHQRFTSYGKDLEKYNRLTILGWRLLRFTPQMVHSGLAIDTICEFLKESPC